MAVCEQLEDPKQARGIVRRGVVEIVTPGVALYDKLLETKRNNYVASVYIGASGKTDALVGLSYSDVSTGEFYSGEVYLRQLIEVLEGITPNEILISKEQKNQLTEEIAKLSYKPAVTKLEPWIFDIQFGREALLGHFKTHNLKGFGMEDFSAGLAAAGAVLYYIKETQNNQLAQINKIGVFDQSDYMPLDFATRRNLEITFSYADGSNEGTLISILDKTCSPMGSRLFKKWITRPLRNLEIISQRLSVVKSLIEHSNSRVELRNSLKSTGDLERLIAKVCAGRANPRDLLSLKNGLQQIPVMKEILSSTDCEELHSISGKMNPLEKTVELIHNSIVEDPSVQLGTGNVFKQGVSAQLDEYIDAKHSGKQWISEYQETERSKSGIPSLKVGFTSVFGYYIEITRTHKDKVPENYERKQTLTNAERYTTPELKQIETKILSAEDNIGELEKTLFSELLIKISLFAGSIQENAMLIASLDCLQSFAEASVEYGYCFPQIDESEVLEIIDGRHPVVERVLQFGEKFFPNSTMLDTQGEQIHIITGPNMSGKSCYLRQVALIVLLAQIGCYVPAKSARIGLVDRIFTRVGAQDNITSGESTFLVEMQEAANIINNATQKSLILLDEVGRGTATFDGISIAWAIAEYLHDSIGAKTLFATHYHELNDLATRYENIANYQVEVIEKDGKVIFSHKVKSGASDHSFGIHVAQMAGLPHDVIERAGIIMKTLEASSKTDDKDDSLQTKIFDVKQIETHKNKRVPEQLAIFEIRDDAIRERIGSLDLNNITPVQALQILYEIKKEVKK